MKYFIACPVSEYDVNVYGVYSRTSPNLGFVHLFAINIDAINELHNYFIDSYCEELNKYYFDNERCAKLCMKHVSDALGGDAYIISSNCNKFNTASDIMSLFDNNNMVTLDD